MACSASDGALDSAEADLFEQYFDSQCEGGIVYGPTAAARMASPRSDHNQCRRILLPSFTNTGRVAEFGEWLATNPQTASYRPSAGARLDVVRERRCGTLEFTDPQTKNPCRLYAWQGLRRLDLGSPVGESA